MATIAVYNSKGGVGKTTLSVNLAWEAVQNGYRTLLWEIDGQGDSSWLLASECSGAQDHKRSDAKALLYGRSKVNEQIKPTKIDGLSVLSADASLRDTENFFVAFSRQNKLVRLFSELSDEFDLIIFDCPPGFSKAMRKVLLVADLIVVPVIPSPLAFRGLTKIRDFLAKHRGAHSPILPVFSMVDYRRNSHKQALEEHPSWPQVSMSTKVENMTSEKLPIGAFDRKSKISNSFKTLWSGIEQKLHALRTLRTRPIIEVPKEDCHS